MKKEAIQKRIENICFVSKQNLNGRETEDELFEAGVKAGIENSYSEEDMIAFAEFCYNCSWFMRDREHKDTKDILKDFLQDKNK
jgi:hypothetical protein